MSPDLYLSYPSAFLIGLLGSTHCLGMCGGISASLSMALPVGSGFRVRQTTMLLAFNAGRIASYALIAALIASSILAAFDVGPFFREHSVPAMIGFGFSALMAWRALR